MLHYNFPPFSVGEVGRMTGVGRREIGHGALAWRAIEAVLPGEDESPYTLRVVSDILESNGSSSMATVCGASLALMQAGIPLKGSVAGVAMGLVKEGDNYAILTDIAGAEDHYGDMDFKVAGTRKGITALQMDIKIMGITPQIMREALEQARRGRLFLLDIMDAAIAAPSEEKSQFAPRIHTLQIPTDKIRDLIGPGGKVIRGIIDATGVKIDVDDTGRVNVASSDAEGLAARHPDDLATSPPFPRSARPTWARWFVSPSSAPSSKSSPAPTACCTSPRSPSIASRRSRTSCAKAIRSSSRCSPSKATASSSPARLCCASSVRSSACPRFPSPQATAEAATSRGDRPERGERSERSQDRPERAPRPERERPASEATITLEGGADFDEDDDEAEGFEIDDEADTDEAEEGEEAVPATAGSAAPQGGNRPAGAGAAAGQQRRRRRRGGRRPVSRWWRTCRLAVTAKPCLNQELHRAALARPCSFGVAVLRALSSSTHTSSSNPGKETNCAGSRDQPGSLWWPFALLCLLRGSRWILSDSLPGSATTLASASLGCGSAAALYILILRPSARERRSDLLRSAARRRDAHHWPSHRFAVPASPSQREPHHGPRAHARRHRGL